MHLEARSNKYFKFCWIALKIHLHDSQIIGDSIKDIMPSHSLALMAKKYAWFNKETGLHLFDFWQSQRRSEQLPQPDHRAAAFHWGPMFFTQ